MCPVFAANNVAEIPPPLTPKMPQDFGRDVAVPGRGMVTGLDLIPPLGIQEVRGQSPVDCLEKLTRCSHLLLNTSASDLA